MGLGHEYNTDDGADVNIYIYNTNDTKPWTMTKNIYTNSTIHIYNTNNTKPWQMTINIYTNSTIHIYNTNNTKPWQMTKNMVQSAVQKNVQQMLASGEWFNLGFSLGLV